MLCSMIPSALSHDPKRTILVLAFVALLGLTIPAIRGKLGYYRSFVTNGVKAAVMLPQTTCTALPFTWPGIIHFTQIAHNFFTQQRRTGALKTRRGYSTARRMK
jgi:hypothetical protein